MFDPRVKLARDLLIRQIDHILSNPRCDDDRAQYLSDMKADLLRCTTLESLKSTYVAYCDSWDALHSDIDPDEDLDDID